MTDSSLVLLASQARAVLAAQRRKGRSRQRAPTPRFDPGAIGEQTAAGGGGRAASGSGSPLLHADTEYHLVLSGDSLCPAVDSCAGADAMGWAVWDRRKRLAVAQQLSASCAWSANDRGPTPAPTPAPTQTPTGAPTESAAAVRWQKRLALRAKQTQWLRQQVQQQQQARRPYAGARGAAGGNSGGGSGSARTAAAGAAPVTRAPGPDPDPDTSQYWAAQAARRGEAREARRQGRAATLEAATRAGVPEALLGSAGEEERLAARLRRDYYRKVVVGGAGAVMGVLGTAMLWRSSLRRARVRREQEQAGAGRQGGQGQPPGRGQERGQQPRQTQQEQRGTEVEVGSAPPHSALPLLRAPGQGAGTCGAEGGSLSVRYISGGGGCGYGAYGSSGGGGGGGYSLGGGQEQEPGPLRSAAAAGGGGSSGKQALARSWEV